jgi:hypothetical protein
MAKDIAEGHILVTERTVRRLGPADLAKLIHEVERKLRELRGESPDLDDTQALQARNRRILRLQGVLSIVRALRQRTRT